MARLENSNSSLENVLNGLNKAADIITSTMGGTGRNVIFYQDRDLSFTKDGVSVARKIAFTNKEEDAGAQLLINAANQTVKQCGDGTTLTCLLTQHFTNNIISEIKSRPVNDVLDEGLLELTKVIDYLKEKSTKIDTVSQIFNIAMTSCKSEKLARLIQEIYNKTGLKANISVEMSEHFNNTYYEISKGLTFNSGLVHPSFSNQTNGNFSAEKPYIWIIDEVATAINDYVDIIDDKHRQKIPLVIIAKDFSDSFIKYVLTNKIQNGLNICLLKHPGYGESTPEDLKDLKTFLTGGYCNKITVTPYEFVVYNNSDKKKIKTRISHLNSQLEVASTDFDKSTLLRRIANLEQVSAIIYVGGVTAKNAKEEYDRIEDAVGACKASLKLGVVKGQGTALYEYAQINQDVLPRWFYETLKAQAYKILENANLQLEPTFEPFNVKTRMMDPTLTDPTDVIVQALLNSFGMSQLIVNSSYIITDN